MQRQVLEQGRIHLDQVATLAGRQGHDDPLSPWHDVGLHAQLAAAHVQLLADPDGSLTGVAHPEPPGEPGTDNNPNRVGQDLLDRAEALLNSAAAADPVISTAPRPCLDQDHLLQARLELASARAFLVDAEPGA